MTVRTKLWTREEYDRLVAAGAFAPDSRIQLINGEIVEMTPQGAAHATALRCLQKSLESVFSSGYDVRTQLPLALVGDPMSEPEPDIAVVPGSIEDYRERHPGTAVLVVEVADSSLDYDRGCKLRMYARAGIPEYWILNLGDRILEVYRDPDRVPETYRAVTKLQANEHAAPLSFPAAHIQVSALLP
jgi:Uma2 family endonuclease